VARKVPVDGGESEQKIELEFPVGDIVPANEKMTNQAIGAIRKASGIPDLRIKHVGISDATPPYKKYILIEIDEGVELEGLKIDSTIFDTAQPEHPITVVTNQVSSGFHVRVFANALSSIPEDPVTGSASSFAARYWATEANIRPGGVIKVRQVSKRGGDLDVIWVEESASAKIRGSARVASRGEIYL